MSRLAFPLTLFAATLMAGMAPAGLLVYEPFDYADGSDVLGQGGANGGFADSWRADGGVPAGSFKAVAGSLAHPTMPGALPTTGGHAYLTGEFGTLTAARDFASEVTGADGDTTWISFLGQRQGDALATPDPTYGDNAYPRGVNIGHFDAASVANPSRSERLAIGNSSNATLNRWGVIPEGNGGLNTPSGTPYESLEWVVVRVDHIGDATVDDNVYMWLSPDPSVEPAIGAADVAIVGPNDGDPVQHDFSGLDFIRPFVGGASSGRPYGVIVIDEYRLGTSYADMTSTRIVPEPAALCLAGLAACGLVGRRRR